MLVDLLPSDDDEGVMEAVSFYLEWLDCANAPAHTLLTVGQLGVLWADCIHALTIEFGEDLYSKRVKVCSLVTPFTWLTTLPPLNSSTHPHSPLASITPLERMCSFSTSLYG